MKHSDFSKSHFLKMYRDKKVEKLLSELDKVTKDNAKPVVLLIWTMLLCIVLGFIFN